MLCQGFLRAGGDGFGVLRGAALLRLGGQLAGQGGGLPLQQRQRGAVRQGGGIGGQCIGAGLGGEGGLLRAAIGIQPLLPRLRLGLGGLLLKLHGAAFQRVHLPAGLLRLIVQGVHLPQGGAQLVDVPLQRGDQAGLVVAAAVQLPFQAVVGFGVGGVLLAGGDEGGNAALQLGVLLHGQGVLTDEGAALEHLPGHAQQHIAGVLAGDAGDGRGGAGVDAGEFAHGRGGAARLPQEGVIAVPGAQLHPSPEGRTVPGRVAVLVGHGAALAGGQTIQHGADESAPGGLAGFVGGVQQIQTGGQVKTAAVETAEDAGKVQNIHGVFLP